MTKQHRNSLTHKRTPGRKGLVAGLLALGLGATGTAIASVIGVGEVVFGAFVTYVAYRAVRYRISPTRAVIEGVKLEQGQAPRDQLKAA